MYYLAFKPMPYCTSYNKPLNCNNLIFVFGCFSYGFKMAEEIRDSTDCSILRNVQRPTNLVKHVFLIASRLFNTQDLKTCFQSKNQPHLGGSGYRVVFRRNYECKFRLSGKY